MAVYELLWELYPVVQQLFFMLCVALGGGLCIAIVLSKVSKLCTFELRSRDLAGEYLQFPENLRSDELYVTWRCRILKLNQSQIHL